MPFELYCELLIVTDLSVYEDHKIFAQSTDQNLVFLHMKAYYAHYANGVIILRFNPLSTGGPPVGQTF